MFTSGVWWSKRGSGRRKSSARGANHVGQESLGLLHFFPFSLASSTLSLLFFLPRWGRRQDLGEKRHAIHWPHGDVERPGHIHGHGGRYCDRVGYIHGRRGRDVDGGNVDRPGDGDWVLKADWRCYVDRVGANVHLGSYGDGVVVVAPVHRRGDGGRNGHRCSWGRVADIVSIWGEKQDRKEYLNVALQ